MNWEKMILPGTFILGIAFWTGVWSCCNATDQTFPTDDVECPNVEDHGASITQRQMNAVCATVIAEAQAGTLSGFRECAVVAQQAMLAQNIDPDTVYLDRLTRGTGIALCHDITTNEPADTAEEVR